MFKLAEYVSNKYLVNQPVVHTVDERGMMWLFWTSSEDRGKIERALLQCSQHRPSHRFYENEALTLTGKKSQRPEFGKRAPLAGRVSSEYIYIFCFTCSLGQTGLSQNFPTSLHSMLPSTIPGTRYALG